MRVRAHFKNIDEVIATIKAVTIKNKDRKKDFHDAGLPSPPDPVITRWATWLRAALYYSENLPTVRTIVNNWTSAGLLVSRAKDAINVIVSLLSRATPRWPNTGVQRWYIVECEKTYKFRNQFYHSTFIPVII